MRKYKKFLEKKVRHRYFSLPAYLLLVLCIAVLIVLPSILYGGLDAVVESLNGYFLWYLLYCVFVAAMIVLIFSLHKYFSFDRHIKRLGSAARKVAEGDFSEYLPTKQIANESDYMDELFHDFNTMVEELGSIEVLKNDFVTNVSHEIKTPLTAIQNYAQILETTELTEEQKEYTRNIVESTQRLADLVSNILKLNKLERQNIIIHQKKFDLCKQLVECAIGFESVWEKKNIEFEAEMEDSAFIEADAELMVLVWNNLLSNAFKFTAPYGSVVLRQYSEEDDVVVEVEDTGCGMSQEEMKHIFDKFYQGDTSHATEGNGLGLALILRVLQIAGGTITVDSTKGKGSIFRVRLPRKVEKEGETDNNGNNEHEWG